VQEGIEIKKKEGRGRRGEGKEGGKGRVRKR
jgi:hypothetical protein